jgi:hypothetical protein
MLNVSSPIDRHRRHPHGARVDAQLPRDQRLGNKDALVFGASKVRETVADRVYELCGGSQLKTQHLTLQYGMQLSRIESLPNLSRWTKKTQSDAFGSYFVRFANPGASGGVESRVYSGRQAPLEWSSAVMLAKIADVEEAFRGRRDLILVYLNKPLALARDFAAHLAASVRPTWLNNDAMPMTQAVTFGISVGAEVHGASQWKAAPASPRCAAGCSRAPSSSASRACRPRPAASKPPSRPARTPPPAIGSSSSSA